MAFSEVVETVKDKKDQFVSMFEPEYILPEHIRNKRRNANINRFEAEYAAQHQGTEPEPEPTKEEIEEAIIDQMKTDQHIYDPEAKQDYLHSIPYFLVGTHHSEIKHEKGYQNTKVSYPDWHMATPAYDIGFAGMNASELGRTLFKWGDSNTLWHRGWRWIREKKKITYCDTSDKIASVVSFLLLLFTLVVTVWSLYIGASEKYVVEDGSKSASADMLNSFATNPYVRYAKAALTGLSAMIIAWNLFKRTTVPKDNNMQITTFSGRNKVKPILQKMGKTIKNLTGIMPGPSGSSKIHIGNAGTNAQVKKNPRNDGIIINPDELSRNNWN